MRVFVRMADLHPACPRNRLDELVDVTDEHYPTVRAMTPAMVIIAEDLDAANRYMREWRCAVSQGRSG